MRIARSARPPADAEIALPRYRGAGSSVRIGTIPRAEPPVEVGTVPLTSQDRELIRRCLHREMGAWNEFVDRYLGLVYHVLNHTAHLRSYVLKPEESEDIAANVLLQIV